ncbi:hypothetical protein J4E89_009593 [Alternaria sp. Ai002NY15]|nr:hypothetical protein J4E89_009593 [Alternaria sp. Ai002NY15]
MPGISKDTTNSSSTGGPDTNISIEDVPITGSGIQNLSADIYNALCDNWEDKKFLPNDEMRHFASEDSIQSIFGAVKAFANMDDLVRFIQNEALRLFLILVLMERKSLERELKSFQDNGFDDHALPIRFNRDNTASAVQGPDQSKRHCVFHHWERGEKELFASYQYRFTAPVFGTTEFHQQVPVGQWLPFLEVAPQPASSGYFGEVTRTVIHAKHIDPSSKLSTFVWTSKEPDQDGKRLQMDAIVIAVKKAKEGDEDPNPSYSRAAFFDKEVENLDRLRKYNSPHLIKPISGYRHGNNRCLIFPWADGGNLGDYWKQFPSHAGNKSRVLWQIRQFVGICSALEALHNDNIRHGDLKPENILWFDRSNNDGGTLQIADLGLAAFHEKEQHTQLRKSGTKTPSGTSRYEPPEMDQQRRTRNPHDPQAPKYGTRSRQYDIWSLGCVVLELLIWLACSPRDVEVFRGDTLYFWQKASEREDGEYMVHEHVVAVMGALGRYFKPGSAYECILQLVETRLLVVKVSRNQEHVPEDCRGSATKVHDCFAEISQRCQTDETFLSPSPDKLTYFQPDPNATRRGSVQRREFHEKNGWLAVPDQRLAAKPTLGPFQTIAESTTAEAAGSLEPELPDVFQLTVRKPTFRQSGDNLHIQVSQASNHQEVRQS